MFLSLLFQQLQLFRAIFGNRLGIRVRGLRRGSVVVDYDVDVPSDTGLNTTSISNGIQTAIEDDIATSTDGFLVENGADPASIEIDGENI